MTCRLLLNAWLSTLVVRAALDPTVHFHRSEVVVERDYHDITSECYLVDGLSGGSPTDDVGFGVVTTPMGAIQVVFDLKLRCNVQAFHFVNYIRGGTVPARNSRYYRADVAGQLVIDIFPQAVDTKIEIGLDFLGSPAKASSWRNIKQRPTAVVDPMDFVTKRVRDLSEEKYNPDKPILVVGHDAGAHLKFCGDHSRGRGKWTLTIGKTVEHIPLGAKGTFRWRLGKLSIEGHKITSETISDFLYSDSSSSRFARDEFCDCDETCDWASMPAQCELPPVHLREHWSSTDASLLISNIYRTDPTVHIKSFWDTTVFGGLLPMSGYGAMGRLFLNRMICFSDDSESRIRVEARRESIGKAVHSNEAMIDLDKSYLEAPIYGDMGMLATRNRTRLTDGWTVLKYDPIVHSDRWDTVGYTTWNTVWWKHTPELFWPNVLDNASRGKAMNRLWFTLPMRISEEPTKYFKGPHD